MEKTGISGPFTVYVISIFIFRVYSTKSKEKVYLYRNYLRQLCLRKGKAETRIRKPLD